MTARTIVAVAVLTATVASGFSGETGTSDLHGVVIAKFGFYQSDEFAFTPDPFTAVAYTPVYLTTGPVEWFVSPQIRYYGNNNGDFLVVRQSTDETLRFLQANLQISDSLVVKLGKQRMAWGRLSTGMVDSDIHPLRRMIELEKRFGVTAAVPLKQRGSPHFLKLTEVEASFFSNEITPPLFARGTLPQLDTLSSRISGRIGSLQVFLSGLVQSPLRQSRKAADITLIVPLASERASASVTIGMMGDGVVFHLPSQVRSYQNFTVRAHLAGYDVAGEVSLLDRTTTHYAVGLSREVGAVRAGPQIRFVDSRIGRDEFIACFHVRVQWAWRLRNNSGK